VVEQLTQRNASHPYSPLSLRRPDAEYGPNLAQF
jgi:hypothetical protein